MNKAYVNKTVLLVLVVVISLLFFKMIRSFLLVLFLAGIFAALFSPLYHKFNGWFGGRRVLAALTTLVIVLFAVIIPLGLLLGVITGQALTVGSAVTPWVSEQLSQPNELTGKLANLPFYDDIAPYRGVIIEKAGQIVGVVSTFLVNNLSNAAAGTVQFLFYLFLYLYALFFFLMDGPKLLRRILYYLPLEDGAEERMLARFTSVTRATLKGTAVIGVVQGGLAGLAFWVLGLDAPLFWATIMTVLSIIPGIGTALVWVPAAIILAIGGSWVKAIVLAAWCGLIVGSMDNLLRPRLVGRDTQMHDLMILFSTLGGLVMFGVAGIIIGPIIAALFVTVWDIYGETFSEVLPAVHGWRPGDPEPEDCGVARDDGAETDGGAAGSDVRNT